MDKKQEKSSVVFLMGIVCAIILSFIIEDNLLSKSSILNVSVIMVVVIMTLIGLIRQSSSEV